MPVPEPGWMVRSRAKTNHTKSTKKRLRYYGRIFLAMPAWLSTEDKRAMKRMYRIAKRTGKTVDHIVPLSNPIVCGLHVPWNMQIIPRDENMQKSNTFWPDCPFEQMNLYVPKAKVSGLTFSEWGDSDV